MTENNLKLSKTHFIIGAIVLVIILFFAFSNKPVAKRTPNLQEQSTKELKNSSEEPTTNAMDTQSAYLKEESARKKQRDIDREECIASVERERIKCKEDGSLFERRACRGADDTNSTEQIDRCYFRFPNN